MLIRRANLVLAWLGCAGLAYIFIDIGSQGTFGQDAHAYWLAMQGGELYEGRPTELDAYLYSPLFVQVLSPLGLLPWPAFHAVWLGTGVAATAWLVRPLPLRWAFPVALTATTDLVIGNIYIFLAVMVALAVRTPYVWMFGVLTKVTPGVGLIWMLARREVAAVLRVVAVTAVVVGVSWALTPDHWAEWIRLLTSSDSGDPLFIPRCVLAAGLVVWGARRHPAWLAVAVTICTPVFNAAACFVPLLAIPRLVEAHRHELAARDDTPASPYDSHRDHAEQG